MRLQLRPRSQVMFSSFSETSSEEEWQPSTELGQPAGRARKGASGHRSDQGKGAPGEVSALRVRPLGPFRFTISRPRPERHYRRGGPEVRKGKRNAKATTDASFERGRRPAGPAPPPAPPGLPSPAARAPPRPLTGRPPGQQPRQAEPRARRGGAGAAEGSGAAPPGESPGAAGFTVRPSPSPLPRFK